MKTNLKVSQKGLFNLLALAILFSSPSMLLAAKAHVISLHVEKVDGKTHWMPATVEVKPGEKIRIEAKDELKGPPEFHGLFIPALHISKQVGYGKTVVVNTTIPKDMKSGEYPIECQFHPTHMPAKLIVK